MKRVHFARAAVALLILPLLTTLPASAAKEGEMCGGIAGIACDEGQFCEFPAGQCGTPDLAGKCEKVPEVCFEAGSDTQAILPVCDCDGNEYANDCKRKMAGAQKSHDGPCKQTE
jgi:hypothetical protein